jgi:uncharacterized membrane protein
VARVRSLNFFQTLFLLYLVLGLLIMTFLVPPFQKSDEPSHYLRAVSISNLDFVCTKDQAGTYRVEMKSKYADLPTMVHTWDVALVGANKFDPDWLSLDLSNPQLNENKPVYDICNLPPPGYLPNVIGIWLGKPFANPLVGFYAGRFVGVLFFVAMLYYAVRLTPSRYRLPIYFFAALPMVLHQAGAISYDVVQLPLFLVLYGYLTKFYDQPGRIRRLDLVLFMTALVVAINVRSLSYVPLLGLYFAVPYAKVAASKLEYAKITGAFLTIAGVITALLSAIYVPRVSSVPVVEGDVSTQKQIEFIFNHPGKFLDASYQTLVHQGDWLFMQTIGIFGWLDAPMSYFPYYVLVFVLGLVFFQVMREDVKVAALPEVGFIFATVAATIACLFLSLYIVWTPVGADQVLGLQGRYFIGLLPFTILAVSQLALIVGRKRFLNAMLLVLAVILVYNMYRTIDLRYYGPEPAAAQPAESQSDGPSEHETAPAEFAPP